MIVYKNKVIHPTKGWLFIEDSKENILNDLEKYTLDPTFEDYGNFVYKPTFETEEQKQRWINEYNENCICIFGNFSSLSHAFYVITDERDFINELETAIRKNQSTKEYKNIKLNQIKRSKKNESIAKR